MKAGPAKSVAAQCAEAAVIGAGASGNVDWNEEKGAIVRAATEIIFANGAARREIRHRDQIGPIGAARANAGLLNSGIDGEWRPGGHGRDIQELPSAR